MGVGRISRLRRGVGVIEMLDAGLHTMRCLQSVGKAAAGVSVLR